MSACVCAACNGTGEVERETSRVVYRYGIEAEEAVVLLVSCPDCGGTGAVEQEPLSSDAETLCALAQALLWWERESWKPYPKRRKDTPEHRED